MKILPSARKHYASQNITDEDVLFVVENPIRVIVFDDENNRTLYLGIDPKIRFLEVVAVELVNGEDAIIHAMKMTKKYLNLLLD
jgi:hypothetical protein